MCRSFCLYSLFFSQDLQLADGISGQPKTMEDSIQMKLNGLHSGTIIRERHIGNGVREQYHQHPETGEIIVVNTWAVQDGECVSFESEVTKVYPYQKGLAECILSIEAISKSVDKYCGSMKELVHG